MYAVDVDLVLRYVPPMEDYGGGIRLTRTIELPFPPAEDVSVFSKTWEGMEDPLGYILKNVTWDMDRNRFLADTMLSVTGTPIAMIPFEICQLVYHGWKYGSYKDNYQTRRKGRRKRDKLLTISGCDWDYDVAEAWETSPNNRPDEFKLVLQAVVATMAELHNNCRVAYAMLKTGCYFDIAKGTLPSDLPVLERRYSEALGKYDALPSDKQWDWAERVKRRYPQLVDVAAAIG